MSDQKRDLTEVSSKTELEAFLDDARRLPVTGTKAAPKGRLFFVMDATASRQPTWDMAASLQAEMFLAAAALGGLSIRLGFYRGLGEFRVSGWVSDETELLRLMGKVRCEAGRTQIARVLRKAVETAKTERLNAVVFVGDCMEEDPAALTGPAGELGLMGVPVFVFHEGDDAQAHGAFAEVARLSGGACLPFDPASPDRLRGLLGAVAAYAAGGRSAMEDYGRVRGGEVAALIEHMRR